MEPIDLTSILDGVGDGSVVPCLGPGVLDDVRNTETGQPIPAAGNSLILALNGGRPMAPKLMYEFPRAAMSVELRRGRRHLNDFLARLYGGQTWTRAALHDWLAAVRPPYVVDINRDTQLQDSYADTPHVLVRGVARIGGTDFRFVLAQHDGSRYRAVTPETVDPTLPVLFKPTGSPLPDPVFLASDADYVDYITELMGGFAIPAFLKTRRIGKRYLFLGMRFNRDTERMVMSEIIHDAADPAGWALVDAPTEKECRFFARKRIVPVTMTLAGFLGAAAGAGCAA